MSKHNRPANPGMKLDTTDLVPMTGTPMTIVESPPNLEDLKSVGTRIRWGAILAGAALALGLYFLLGILGAAVGLSISANANPVTLTNAAIAWAIGTTCVGLFLGGMVASVFTVGENKVEAMLYGIIMWAVLLAFFMGLGAAGVHTGFNAMADLSIVAQTTGATERWEASARLAGLSPEQIEQWRTTVAGSPEAAARASQLKASVAEHAPRIAWCAFFGVWLSMFAAAAGAVVGAGPTFRLLGVHVVAVRGVGRMNAEGNGHPGNRHPVGRPG